MTTTTTTTTVIVVDCCKEDVSQPVVVTDYTINVLFLYADRCHIADTTMSLSGATAAVSYGTERGANGLCNSSKSLVE